MKFSYIVSYCWKSLCNRSDRIFSFLNVFSIAMTIMILVILTGLLKTFKEYSENILNSQPLRIEVFKSKEALYKDLKSLEKDIKAIEGVSVFAKRTAADITFVTKEGARVVPKGSSMIPIEPFKMLDVRRKAVAFRSKPNKEVMDEVGLIVTFDLLINLGYLSPKAIVDKKESWSAENIPESLNIELKQGNEVTILPVPVLGVVRELDRRGDYLMTEDFLRVTKKWKTDFTYMLKDRNKDPLVVPEPEIKKGYYILQDEEVDLVDEKYEILEACYDKFLDEFPLEATLETWETDDGFQERLEVLPLESDSIPLDLLAKVDKFLRAEFPFLKVMQKDAVFPSIRTWKEFLPLEHEFQYMQGAVYVKRREHIQPCLNKLRGMGLFASSPLERYLKTFTKQESFYVGASIAIFLLIISLAGIVLFSTFYASTQRKRKEVGILKASGASGGLIRRMLYIEGFILTFIGTGVGLFAGIKIGEKSIVILNQIAKVDSDLLVFSLPFSYMGYISLFIFVFCWLAIFVPAWLASNTDPAQVVRH